MPWTVPSSPGVPWSALNTTSGLQIGERRGDVAVHVDPGDAMAAALERIGDAVAADQRDLALGRPAAHQHRDVEPIHAPPSSPDRRAWSPLSCRSTALPSPNDECHAHPHALDFPFEVDAAVGLDPAADFLAQRLDLGRAGALPRLSRKLQCFSETWASPIAQAAAAGGVDQPPGLGAGRVLEGRAAGAAAQRLALLAGARRSGPSRRWIAAGSPGMAAEGGVDDDAPSGSSLWR